MTAVLAFALANWKAILAAGALISLGTLLLIARGDAQHYHKLSDQNAASADLANSKLLISNASIASLTNALNAKNAESEKRAADFQVSKTQDAKSIADMDARAKADASRLDTLQRLAKDLPDNPNCKAPAALLAQLKGL